jgi:predicted nucleic acid-binding protein
MQAFDASSIIYGWDNYPIEQFPGLWTWISTQINKGNLAIATVAFDEVRAKTPDCAQWLLANNIQRLDLGNPEVEEAQRIKLLLKIQNDDYHSRGVGENDLFIIAIAKVGNHSLITDEARQIVAPIELRKLKIPGVCSLPSVRVTCINFVDFLKNSGVSFG